MIRFQDVTRQKAWMRAMQVKVEEVGQPQETQHGFCQAITLTDGVGITETFNYFFPFPEAEVLITETGTQFYDLKWDDKMGLFKCKPATPPPSKELVPEKGPDWDKINLGKCRHGILCATIENGGLIAALNNLETINRLAEFSMTGEIHENFRCETEAISG